MDKENKIIQGDCIEEMKKLEENSIDAIVTDPPYNIGKAEWDKIDNYIEWCGEWVSQCERVLKNPSSFYWFHSNIKIAKDIMKYIEDNTDFKFRQMIVWNKRFTGAKNKDFLNGFVQENRLQNYNKMAEYCFYYVIDGINKIKKRRKKLGLSQSVIAKEIRSKNGNLTGWYSNIENGKYYPTKETIKPIKKHLGLELNDIVPTFNNQKTHHSVWNYEIAEKKGHITPKPILLIENILKHSSNENDIVLDPFTGSGTTLIACKRLNRNYIGIEMEEEYIQIAEARLQASEQKKLL